MDRSGAGRVVIGIAVFCDEHEEATAALEQRIARGGVVVDVAAGTVIESTKTVGAQIVGALVEAHAPGSP